MYLFRRGSVRFEEATTFFGPKLSKSLMKMSKRSTQKTVSFLPQVQDANESKKMSQAMYPSVKKKSSKAMRTYGLGKKPGKTQHMNCDMGVSLLNVRMRAAITYAAPCIAHMSHFIRLCDCAEPKISAWQDLSHKTHAFYGTIP